MASATGTIAFSGLPDQYDAITINDGQDAVGSEIKLGFITSVSNTHQNNAFLSGTAASNNTVAGNAENYVPVYLTGVGSKVPFFYFSFDSDSQSLADWRTKFVSDGTHPAVLKFTQPGYDGNVIDFVNMSSGIF